MRVVGKGVAGSFPYWSHIIWQNFTIQIRIIHVYLSKHSKLWFWLWIVTSKEKRINLNVLVKGISDELLFLNFSFSSSQSLSPFASTKVLGGSQVPQTHVDHVQGNAQDHGWHYASNCLSTSRRKMRGLKEGKNSSFLVGFPNLKKLPTWSWWGRVAFHESLMDWGKSSEMEIAKTQQISNVSELRGGFCSDFVQFYMVCLMG